jgi:hypothetical protein
MFIKGTLVQYKNCIGVVNFVSNKYITILIKEGLHRSQDVEILAYIYDFANVEILGEK